jgi:hypothetical protein
MPDDGVTITDPAPVTYSPTTPPAGGNTTNPTGNGTNFVDNGAGGSDFKGMRAWENASENPNNPVAQQDLNSYFFGPNGNPGAGQDTNTPTKLQQEGTQLASGISSIGKGLTGSASQLYKTTFGPNTIYPVSPNIQQIGQQQQNIQFAPIAPVASDKRLKTNIQDGTRSVKSFLEAVYKNRKQ